MMRTLGIFVVLLLAPGSVLAQQNRIDRVSPLAPEFAVFGPHAVGVQTIQVTDRNRIDVLATKAGAASARYDRSLTLEIWYPAALAAGQRPGGEYRTVTRDPQLSVTLRGSAVRDARPAAGGPVPLVLISHGYPGNRLLLSHMGESLASRGFVVASIDHKDSTYDDQKEFSSTLYNRPFDQLFVINEIARLAQPGSGSFLSGIADANRTGLVGYSMGGYGVVNVIGGGFSEASVTFSNAPPNRLLAERTAVNRSYASSLDSRIKAAIAIGPWGMQNGFWDADGLKGIRTPVLFVAGSADDVSQYEKGVKAIFEGAVNADRYLLTFVNAGHNAGAPIPPPFETYQFSSTQKSFPFMHYADGVWDNVRMNNILDHFAVVWFDWHLKGDSSRQSYLDSSTWRGFRSPRAAVGLQLEHRTPQQ
jgi:predicted dienelactone hydrolase